MKKKLIACIALFITFLSSSLLFAHEFWIMPSKFRLQPDEFFTLNFYVGEDFNGELWAKRRERTARFTHFSKRRQEDLTALAIKSDSGDVVLKFNTVGTHLLSFESKNSFIGLDAAKFNNYLKEDGIDNIYDLRKKTGTLTKNSRELYRRCVKTLVQVGDKTDKIYGRTIGTTLEVVPLKNPYDLKLGDEMSVQILYEGKPLTDKLVVVWNKSQGVKTRHQQYRTDKKGKIRFPLDKKGDWMVSLVQMIPISDNAKADYQSLWGDLTFGF